MPKIKILDAHEAHKIAAGEIVEKPAHVVKELVENSIDAGATHIQIYIKKGGKQLIRVVDNGSGMDAEDAKCCFEHHATSKISTVDDLSSLQTFGFRGEALSAIASIARVTLITKTAQDLAGTHVIMNAGKLITHEAIHARTGTDISIEDLLYNVPARKKFLKKDETHWRQIVKLFHALVFCYPSIHFELHYHEVNHYQCPPVQKPIERFTQLFGHQISSKMITLNKQQEASNLSGFISDPKQTCYDRSNIYIFINNRWIKNNIFIRSVIQGYEGILRTGMFPRATLHIEIAQEDLDVNIHPRKEEVQYRYEHQLARLIKTTIQHQLQQQSQGDLHAALIPTTLNTNTNDLMSRSISVNNSDQPIFKYQIPFYNDTFTHKPPLSEPAPKENFTPMSTEQPIAEAQQATTYQAQQSIIKTEQPIIIGQYAHTYILIEHPEGLLFVDQHAAHERILFEQLKNQQSIERIPLIFPIQMRFSTNEMMLLQEHRELLQEFGIMVEIFGPQEICIREIPLYAQAISLPEIIETCLKYFGEYKKNNHETLQAYIDHKLYALIACKNSVRAGDPLSIEKMQEIVRTLAKCIKADCCPHARPTYWLLNSEEIVKKFKRDYRSSAGKVLDDLW